MESFGVSSNQSATSNDTADDNKLKVIKPGDGVKGISKKQTTKKQSAKMNKRKSKQMQKAMDYADRVGNVEVKKWHTKIHKID